MWRSRRNRDGSKGYETCETCALCSAGRFHVIMDDLLLSEVQIIEKNREQTKNTTGLYWEVYIRKTKGIIKISGKKKEEKYWSQRFEEDWIESREKSLRRNFYWPFLPNKEQSTYFYSNQGLYFQYQKENDQECTVRNPALKSLGRWNEKGMGGN